MHFHLAPYSFGMKNHSKDYIYFIPNGKNIPILKFFSISNFEAIEVFPIIK